MQDNILWAVAGLFAIIYLLFFSLYKLWGRIKYNLYSNYFIVFLIYIFNVFINISRLGVVYIVTFTIFVSIIKIYKKVFKFNCISIYFTISCLYNLFLDSWFIL